MEEVPETGAVFTFGRSRFGDDNANKFWVKNDPIIKIACGDEHTAVVTSTGKCNTRSITTGKCNTCDIITGKCNMRNIITGKCGMCNITGMTYEA